MCAPQTPNLQDRPQPSLLACVRRTVEVSPGTHLPRDSTLTKQPPSPRVSSARGLHEARLSRAHPAHAPHGATSAASNGKRQPHRGLDPIPRLLPPDRARHAGQLERLPRGGPPRAPHYYTIPLLTSPSDARPRSARPTSLRSGAPASAPRTRCRRSAPPRRRSLASAPLQRRSGGRTSRSSRSRTTRTAPR